MWYARFDCGQPKRSKNCEDGVAWWLFIGVVFENAAWLQVFGQGLSACMQMAMREDICTVSDKGHATF